MKDPVDPRDRAATHGGLAQIALQKLDLAIQAGDIRGVTRAEIVDDPNGVAESDQPLSDMGADKARSPCDEASRRLGDQHAIPAVPRGYGHVHMVPCV